MLLLFSYYFIVRFIPFAGHPAGMFTEHINVCLHFDQMVLGTLQSGETYTALISVLTYVATVISGALTARLLTSGKEPLQKYYRLLAAGAILVIAGVLWGSLDLPIVKKAWSSSYVVLTSGMSILFLAFFYYVCDIRKIVLPFRLFSVIGANSIFAYVFFQTVGRHFFYTPFHRMTSHLSGDVKNLFVAAGGFLCLWLLLYFMQRKKIFLKV